MEHEENMQIESSDRKRPVFHLILLVQAVGIGTVLLTLAIVRFFFSTQFAEIRDWYERHFTVETTLSTVLSTPENPFPLKQEYTVTEREMTDLSESDPEE